MVCMQTPTARGRRTCSRKKSPGSADGWQSDLFHVRMVTPMQIALTRLKARYWHWVSSVSWPAIALSNIRNEIHIYEYKSMNTITYILIDTLVKLIK